MAGQENTIKTRLTLDGEKEFKQGIASINKDLALGNAQLKEIAAQYARTGDAQGKLTAESKILQQQIEAQNRIAQQYAERLEQARKASDLSADGLKNYEIDATNARRKLEQLNEALEKTQKALQLQKIADEAAGVKSATNKLASDMRVLAAEFDLTGDKAEYLSQKSRLLTEQIETQKNANSLLVQTLTETANQYGRTSKEFDAAYLNYNEGKIALSRLEKQAKDTDRELEEFGRDSRRAGDQLEDNLGEAAEETESKMRKLARSVEDSLGGMKKLQRVSVAVDIVRGAWDFAESLSGYVQNAVEDGMKKAMVQFNIIKAGGNLATSMPLVNQFAAIFGDRESAYEAVANLTAAGYTDASLTNISKYIGGAAIRFQDTLKIESLADSLQESLSEGKLTGQIAELVNRLAAETGITEEQVNAQLAEAKLQGNEKVALEAYLRNAGLDTYYDDFVKQNEALVESATALQSFNDALNDLAVTTLPLLTPAIKGTAELFDKLATPLKTFMSYLVPDDPNADPYEEDRKAIEEEKKKIYGENWTPPEVETKPQEEKPVGAFQHIGDKYLEALDWLAGTGWAGNALAYALGRPTVAGGEAAKSEVEGLKPNAEMSKYVTLYSDTASAYQQAAERNKEIRNRLRLAGTVATPTIETSYKEGVLEGWDGSQWTVVEDVESKLTEAAEAAETGGQNVGESLANGLQQKRAMVLTQASLMRDGLERVWRDPITPTVVVGYQMAGPVNKELPALTVNLQGQDVVLDKRKVGSIVGQSINVGWGALLNGITK